MKKYIYVVVVVILLVLVAFWVYFRNEKTPSQGQVNIPTPTADSNAPLLFTSQALGISFQYPRRVEVDITAGVKESGDKVFVFTSSGSPEDGQFVQIFKKDPNETFEASIKRQILAEYPSKDCKITVTRSNIFSNSFVAEIDYPAPTNPEDPYWKNYELCNKDYARTNGIRYFLYDENFSDRFAYFSIGQYGIPLSENGKMWQDTFKFISN